MWLKGKDKFAFKHIFLLIDSNFESLKCHIEPELTYPFIVKDVVTPIYLFSSVWGHH